MTTNNESNLSLELAWAKVLLKSCLDVLETHNEPIVKRLRNDVSDFLKDDYNLLKKQKKFNTSEENVKEDNIKSGKTKHGDFIVKYLEEGSHYKVKEINVMENVAQRNSQDLERVADTSKTLDHIVDTTEKVSLTEQWKKAELPKGYYYAEDDGEELIIHIQGQNGSVMGDDFDLKATDWIKPIEPVPSYEEWQQIKDVLNTHKYYCCCSNNEVLRLKLMPFDDPYFKGLTTKDIAELAKKSIRLTKQSCEDNTTIQRLKELLCYCADVLEEMDDKDRDIEILLEEVNEVLR